MIALTAAPDPRNPLVLDTHELSRRPGSMKRVNVVVPAPERLGIDVIGVREGKDLTLDLRLESVVEGILVTGTAQGPVDGDCVRCLDPLAQTISVDFQELYLYDSSARSDDDEDQLFELRGDLLDLEPVVRNAVVLALPLQPVCRDDCPGLCSECGARLGDDPSHRHETVDNRWAALVGMLDQGAAGSEPGRSSEGPTSSASETSPQNPAPSSQER